MRIEVCFATPSRQELLALDVEAPISVAAAIRLSGIEERFPGHDLSALDVGIWGRTVSRETMLGDGDRVEIYRPLQRDPREARRLRAEQKEGETPSGIDPASS